jgi:hypothetical protein
MPHGKAVRLELSDIERGELERLVRRHKTAQALALRGRIIPLAADGLRGGPNPSRPLSNWSVRKTF